MDKSFGLSAQTIQKLINIFSQYDQIEKVLIYGSRAKGNFRTGSDIDLTLVGPSLNTTTLLKVENDIDDLLLPQEVDLSIFEHIDNPDVVTQIKENGIVFFSRS
jgi:uncharacterized protein